MNIRKTLGFDGAVAYTFLARSINILGSTGTVLLIVRFLSPVEQGYYYTLLSLVSLQLIFEMGFSLVIQQLAAHECIHLELHGDGAVSGDQTAHRRLASALQLSLRWYTLAAVAMVLILAPLGIAFFARHVVAGAARVAWQGPWITAVLASSLGLWCTPLYAFLEGCGQVREVASMRLRQAIAACVFAWMALLLHHGLYSPALVIVGQTGTGLLFLATRRRFLAGLLRHPAGDAAIRWSREVWPFQWRIAVSWMCSFFTLQIFIPLLFALRGAVEAGQMGMSVSITGYITVLALAWSTTKSTPFGRLIARREFKELDRLFQRTLYQSLAVFSVIAVASCTVVALLPMLAPRLAVRMVTPPMFAVLVLAAGANCVVQSLATLLHAFKREPFLGQSLAVASITLLLAYFTTLRLGITGAAFSYLAASAGIGLPIAVMIFARARRNYLITGTPAAFEVKIG